MATQDASVVRMAGEFLANGFIVVASGCAAAGLAKAGYMDPSKPKPWRAKAQRIHLSPFRR